jgi:hypothetical protein
MKVPQTRTKKPTTAKRFQQNQKKGEKVDGVEPPRYPPSYILDSELRTSERSQPAGPTP